MRKLSAICRRLRRFGVFACVVCHGRGDYVIHAWRSAIDTWWIPCNSVKECEEWLNGLFPRR